MFPREHNVNWPTKTLNRDIIKWSTEFDYIDNMEAGPGQRRGLAPLCPASPSSAWQVGSRRALERIAYDLEKLKRLMNWLAREGSLRACYEARGRGLRPALGANTATSSHPP
jgi:hypothetical protein